MVSNNMIAAAKHGAVRAMNHAKATGPDLSVQSSESFRNVAVFANVAF